MARRTIKNVYCFSEIFRFAESRFGVLWNPCNQLFFDNTFEYKRLSKCDVDDITETLCGYDLMEPVENETITIESLCKKLPSDEKVKELYASYYTIGQYSKKLEPDRGLLRSDTHKLSWIILARFMEEEGIDIINVDSQ